MPQGFFTEISSFNIEIRDFFCRFGRTTPNGGWLAKAIGADLEKTFLDLGERRLMVAG